MVGTVSLLELAYDQAAQARRRGPVHRAPVIARLIITQCMEGHVRAGQFFAGHTFDIHLHTRRVKREAHRRRMHVHQDRLVPGAHAAQQAQAVHTHGARRAHVDHAAALRHHRKCLVPRAVRADRRHQELATASSDRDLHDRRTRAMPGLVHHADAPHRHLTGNDAIILHAQGHRQRRRGRDRGDRDHEGHQAHHGNDEALQPSEGRRGDATRGRDRDHRPPDRRERAQPTGRRVVTGQGPHAFAQGTPRAVEKST